MTMQRFGVRFQGATASADDDMLDRLMDALLDAGVDDPVLYGALAAGEVEVTIEVEGADPAAALATAQHAVDAALEASGLGGGVTWRHVGVEPVLVA